MSVVNISIVEWHSMKEVPDCKVCPTVYVRTGRWNLAVVTVRKWESLVLSGELKGEPSCWAYASDVLSGACDEPKLF